MNEREEGLFCNIANNSVTLDRLRGTELPTMHLTNDVTWEFNDKDYFARLMQR